MVKKPSNLHSFDRDDYCPLLNFCFALRIYILTWTGMRLLYSMWQQCYPTRNIRFCYFFFIPSNDIWAATRTHHQVSFMGAFFRCYLLLYRFVLCNNFLKFYFCVVILEFRLEITSEKFLVKLDWSYINCARGAWKIFYSISRAQKTFLLGLMLAHCQEQTRKIFNRKFWIFFWSP